MFWRLPPTAERVARDRTLFGPLLEVAATVNAGDFKGLRNLADVTVMH